MGSDYISEFLLNTTYRPKVKVRLCMSFKQKKNLLVVEQLDVLATQNNGIYYAANSGNMYYGFNLVLDATGFIADALIKLKIRNSMCISYDKRYDQKRD